MKRFMFLFILSIFIGINVSAVVSNSTPYDTARIYKVMSKARNGENVVLGFIGGSITQGSLASTESKRWVNLVAAWWKAKFPTANFTIVNAGIGGTGSDIGTFRVQKDLLSQKPDFVMIEFSVNDADFQNTYVQKMMEGLLRQILADTSEIGVMMLQLKMENGGTAQAAHKVVGDYYKIPMISFADMIDTAVTNDGKTLRNIFGDNPGVHPNDLGMSYIAEFITNELNTIAGKLPADASLPAQGDVPAPLVSDVFQNTYKYNPDNLIPVTNTGWSDNWTCTKPGDEMVFKIEGNAITVEYNKDDTKERGKVEVWVDDQPHKVLDAYFNETWGTKAVFELVAEGLSDGEHLLHIKGIEESSTGGNTFYLTGIGKAGKFDGTYPVAECQTSYKAVKARALTLDGSKSFDPDGDTLKSYNWQIISKPASGNNAVIIDHTKSVAVFTPDVEGTYTLGFDVSDGVHASTTREIKVNVLASNSAPVANAGNDTTVATGKYVKLTDKSTDADGNQLTAKWRLISEPEGGKTSIPSKLNVRIALEGTYKFGLIVNDSIEDSKEDTLVVKSIPNYTEVKVNKQENIRLFPNPADKELQIITDGAGYRVQISDLSGKILIDNGFAANTGITMNISSLNKGTYLVSLINSQGFIQTSKLIIAR